MTVDRMSLKSAASTSMLANASTVVTDAAGAPLQVYHAPASRSGPPGARPHRGHPSVALSSGALVWFPLKPLQVPFLSSP